MSIIREARNKYQRDGLFSLIKIIPQYTISNTHNFIRRQRTRYLLNWFTAKVGNLLIDARSHHQYKRYRKSHNIDPTFEFRGPEIKLYGSGDFTFDAESYISRYSNLKSAEGQEISIGKNAALGHYIFMFTKNRVADQDLSQAKLEQKGDITIGNNTWIGAFVFITSGCSIGDGAVVGAHSVVTKDIPPHSISAGSPAKVIKFKTYLDRESRERLAKNYWDVLSDDLQVKYE